MRFRDTRMCYILLDFNNIVWRSFFGTQRENMVNDNGINVGFIIGFFKILSYAINKAKNSNFSPMLVIATDRAPTRKRELYRLNQELFKNHKPDKDWDGDDDPQFRVRYKGNRASKDDIGYNPVEICQKFARCITHTNIYYEGEEADDIIASFIHNTKQTNILLYSTDKDLWQLLQYPNVTIFGSNNDEITEEMVIKNFAGDHRHIHLNKIITGDTGDNVKSVFRYPFKSTIKEFQQCDGTFKDYVRLLKESGNYKALQMLRENIKLIQFNSKVVKLRTDINYNKECFVSDINNWKSLCQEYQTFSLKNSSFTNIF